MLKRLSLFPLQKHYFSFMVRCFLPMTYYFTRWMMHVMSSYINHYTRTWNNSIVHLRMLCQISKYTSILMPDFLTYLMPDFLTEPIRYYYTQISCRWQGSKHGRAGGSMASHSSFASLPPPGPHITCFLADSQSSADGRLQVTVVYWWVTQRTLGNSSANP